MKGVSEEAMCVYPEEKGKIRCRFEITWSAVSGRSLLHVSHDQSDRWDVSFSHHQRRGLKPVSYKELDDARQIREKR